MTYVKLPKGCTDYSAGFQSVNQLYDNFDASRILLAGEHGMAEPTWRNGRMVFPRSTEALGRHSTPKVCRAVVRVRPVTVSFSVISPGAFDAKPVVTSVTRLGMGLYLIGIVDLLDFYGVCTAEGDDVSAGRFIVPRSGFGNGAPVGIGVELYEEDGAGLDLADFDFSVHVYGNTA